MAKKSKIDVHVNRMGSDGVHMFWKCRIPGAFNYTLDLKYDDLPDGIQDLLVVIGEQLGVKLEALDLDQNEERIQAIDIMKDALDKLRDMLQDAGL